MKKPNQNLLMPEKKYRSKTHLRSDFCGFTLVEILVVIVIIGVLAALIVPKVMSRPDQARVVAAQQDMNTLAQAVKLFKLDNKRYPTTEEGLKILVEGANKPGTAASLTAKGNGYIERLPTDPWGNNYQYAHPGLHGPFDIFSYGADGKPGGEGFDADIGQWEQ